MVVLWSADAVKSEWVRSEANRAREAGKLVQTAVEALTPPMPFDTLECANLVGWKGDAAALGWTKVLAGVAALTGGEAPGPARAAAAPRRRRPMILAAVAALVVVAAAIAGVALWGPLHKAPPPSLRTVALLPVRNLSGDPALDPVADALTADTTTFWAAAGSTARRR